jgi:hypothetical protein
MTTLAHNFELIESADPLLGDDDTALNSASVSGPDSPEWRTLLDRPMTFLLPRNKNKDARQTEWKNGPTAPLRSQLIGGAGAGLTQHAEKKAKGYFPIVFGAAAGAGYVRRTANGMKTVEMVGIDVDSGDDYTAALERVEAEGLACVAYTSFRDGAEKSKVKRDTVLRALNLDREPTTAELRAYLAPKLRPEILETVEIVGQDHDEAGVQIVYSHAPLWKYRLLFPLAQALPVASLGVTQRAQQDRYARHVRGLAHKLDLLADEACFDVARVFYMPSHPEGSNFALDVIRGRGLTLADMPEAEKGGPKNAFEAAGAGAETEREIAGMPAKAWAAQYAKRLRVADLIMLNGPERVREDKGNLLVVECPFDEWHSNAGDPDDSGCHVRDADGDSGFIWTCKHNSCTGHDRLDMLHKAVADGWFDESCLESDDYLEPLSDEELSAEDARFEPRKDWLPARYKVRGGTIWGPGTKEDDDDTPLCQAFDVIGRASNVTGDSGAGRIICFSNENGAEVELTISMAELVKPGGGGVLERLADAGMTLYLTNRSREPILNLFRQIHPQRHVPTVPRPGWVKDRGGVTVGYMCPTGEYIEAEPGHSYRLASAATTRDRASAGTLDGWKEAAHAAFADIPADAGTLPPNYFWVIGACAGFVGPLLSLIGVSGRGFNLSGEAARGKTLSLLLGSTVWATPADKGGVLFSMSATANAVEILAMKGSETFLGLDELGAMQRPQDLSSILFVLSGGGGKARMASPQASGGLGDSAEFCSFVMLTSERTLRATIRNAGEEYRPGLSRRYPDLNVTAGARVSGEIIDRMKLVQRNYGHAGPVFVRWLIDRGWHNKGHELSKRVDAAADILVADGLADDAAVNPAQKEAAKVFALPQIAGELACEAGLLPDADKVRAAILTAWQTFRASDEGKATEGEASMLDGFRSWFAGADGVHLTDASDPDARLYRERWGWTTDTHIILIADKVDMRAMGLSGTVDGLLKALKDAGALEMSGQNRKWTNLPAECGGGKVTNIRIKRAELGMPPPERLGHRQL